MVLWSLSELELHSRLNEAVRVSRFFLQTEVSGKCEEELIFLQIFFSNSVPQHSSPIYLLCSRPSSGIISQNHRPLSKVWCVSWCENQLYKSQLAFPLIASTTWIALGQPLPALPTACQKRHLASVLECYLLPVISSTEGGRAEDRPPTPENLSLGQERHFQIKPRTSKTFLGN